LLRRAHGGSFSPIGSYFVIPISIDVNVTSIDFDYTDFSSAAPGAFNGYVFVFSDAPEIISAAVNPLSTFSPTSLDFTSDSVFVNAASLSFTPDSRLVVDLRLAAVPEPSPTALFAIGFPLLACWHFRRRTAASAGKPPE
jgi:hypothetical protein